jgi:hypothetical protein
MGFSITPRGNQMKLTFFCLLIAIQLFATGPLLAQLTVMDPQIVGSKSGYIDEATIVIEPHGGYVEESMYLEYGDHGQYLGNSNIEITHQFELPTGTAVNDLWLWIDNKVMKGIVLDVWTGRHIYDSIVVRKKDPAFLVKSGSHYTLKIYPLVSGKRRKVKINFIAPTRWIGDSATAELPLALLKANTATTKPVRVLFKTGQNVWGIPTIKELPLLQVKSTFDSLGYKYRFFQLPDISNLTSFSVGFLVGFQNSLYAPPLEQRGDSTFFQFGVSPRGWDVVSPDTASQQVAVALDLSGFRTTTLATELSRVKSILRRSLRPVDRFRLFVAGRDSIKLFGAWNNGDTTTISSVLNQFAASPFGVSLNASRKPTLVFCDQSAVDLWSFTGIDSFAVVKKFTDFVTASASFTTADIVASYRHGYEQAGSVVNNLALLLGRTDTLFMRGGRFVAFYDYNRPGKEAIASNYINGLTATYNHSFPSENLISQPGGYISSGFLPTYSTGAVNYLTYSDVGVLKELASVSGEPAVISKAVGDGHLVVSGLWTFAQDATQRKSLAIPILGLAAQASMGGAQRLRSLLGTVRSTAAGDSVDQVLVLSNADSVVNAADADAWGATHIAGYGSNPPVFNTINLQSGSGYLPGVLTVNGVEYYGGGYQLQALATVSHGMHFETHIRDWNYIISSLAYSSNARLDSLRVTATPSGSSGAVREWMEIAPEPGNYQKPRFFRGISGAATSMKFTAYARFVRVPGELQKEVTAYANADTAKFFLMTMTGWDKLQSMFLTSSTDTAGIVKAAVGYNLLCDYTCLLCLEPDSLHRPILNPIDESGFVTSVAAEASLDDSLFCGAYPNPFNGQTTISVGLKRTSDVSISIYNMLGQRVREVIRDGVVGALSATWNGTNDRGSSVASGVYIVRVNIKDQVSGRQDVRTLRVMLLK